jgi:hypothetical protein
MRGKDVTTDHLTYPRVYFGSLTTELGETTPLIIKFPKQLHGRGRDLRYLLQGLYLSDLTIVYKTSPNELIETVDVPSGVIKNHMIPENPNTP